MVQGQLDDNTEFGDLLELQEQIRALQTELAEVKQADDEELDKLLDQNGTCSGLATCKLPVTRQWLYSHLCQGGFVCHLRQVRQCHVLHVAGW